MTSDLALIRRRLSSQTWTCLQRGRANLLIVRISYWVLIQTWPIRAQRPILKLHIMALLRILFFYIRGHSFTGPSVHGPTDQHNYTGHLQLAQQLTSVMGHSSSGLTLFEPSTLHFYQGPPLETNPVSPSPPTSIHHSSVSPSSTPPLHASNVSSSSILPNYPH